MQGLWPNKDLMVSTNNTMGVSEKDQISVCEETKKDHFKNMYDMKEYMEEYLKFKEVIANMKKWNLNISEVKFE